ncbi:MAG: tRNA preQ1(34) S-adenosylmethionine ribosyltransferase-isomerase QueA [Candidatus Omnitrophica bacterium]|nr:tRNA preQ1(34) S-adenosylmethionine ribosyltransferase-isomerase QueA [Candidatus Omnitrophota bacterium]
MRLSDFDYDLPRELIAQHPLPERDASKLLVLHRDSGRLKDSSFKEVLTFFKKGDLLVLNDTKVFKARLLGNREGLEGKVEVLLSDRREDDLYAALCKPSRKLKQGTTVVFGDGLLKAEIIGIEGEFRLLRFKAEGDLTGLLEKIGRVPLPPYIKRDVAAEDENRYQTVYAKNTGAIAAPTAGLHFTDDLINAIKAKGVDIAYITLHVGYATFKPVTEEDISKHKMHKEYYSISGEAAGKVNNAKRNNNRVIAVGTTACRALEASAKEEAAGCELKAESCKTDLFIYPGYKFKITDALLTNFHLPHTTLLMLVSAFAGREHILRAYQKAIDLRYRFYSYGDAMLVL